MWCCIKPWASSFTPHCPSSLSCMNEYLAIDNGGSLMYEQSSLTKCSVTGTEASQRSRDGVRVNRSAGGELSSALINPDDLTLSFRAYTNLPFYLFIR